MVDGLNISFPIYVDVNGAQTPFHGITLKKATYECEVMALGDKISGDFVYIGTDLEFSMQEYVEYEGVKYYIVNPPTIVREGIVGQNSELGGATRYSVVFYHPMYELSSLPFTDVAVSQDEAQYKSQDTSFYWVGYLADFVLKIDKNLQNTRWTCVLNAESLEDEGTKISDVMQFTDQMVADALKTCYDTFKAPYVIEPIEQDEPEYGLGKRFRIVFGFPSNEIIPDGQSEPYVFRFGQGLGLKNHNATPRNNKIITRIAPYGSEDNIPYGYPQIVWAGDQTWQYTLDNESKPNSYPIYDGIVGGRYVKLIKHPFTRNHLMPSVFVDCVNRKVNPYADGYDPNTELVHYIDADSSYPHPINLAAPSYEAHQFEEIKPELTSRPIDGARPYNGNYDPSAITLAEFNSMIDDFIASSTNPVEISNLRDVIKPFVNAAQDGTMVHGANHKGTSGEVDFYEYEYEFEIRGNYANGYYISSGVNFTCAVNITGEYIPSGDDVDWDDSVDDNGNYKQSYFILSIPALGFDLYACAAITQEMNIVMRSGACIGCTFPIQCDWERYKASFYDADGNFAPDGEQRDKVLFPDTTNSGISVIVAKDTNTFGKLMPNVYQVPQQGDLFVVTGISLPQEYVTWAQGRLDDEAASYMLKNNVYYFDYPLTFDEHFLALNTDILNKIHTNVIVRFGFNDDVLRLFVKSINIKYGEAVLPQYDITLSDEIEITLNQIGQAVETITLLGHDLQMLQRYYDEDSAVVNRKLSRVSNDSAQGNITFLSGLSFRRGGINSVGDAALNSVSTNKATSNSFATGFDGNGWRAWLENGLSKLEVDDILVRRTMNVYELLIHKVRATGGAVIVSAADGKIRTVSAAQFGQWDIEVEDIDGVGFRNGDYVRCQRWDATRNTIKSYWVQVVGSYSNHLILSGDFTSGVPEAGDELVLMGSSVASRQGAVMISAQEGGVPVVDVLNNISGASLAGCLRARLGGLDGIIDPYFGEMQPQGYGLYSDNAWLRGTFVLRNGEEVGTKFAILEDRVSSSVAGYVDAILVVNPTFDGWDGWNVPQSQVNLLTLDGDYIFESGVPVSGFNVLGGAELIDGGGIRFNTNYTLTQTIPNTSIRPDMRYYLEVEYKGDLTEWQVGSIIGGETSEEWKVAIFDVESLYSELGDDCVLTVNTNTEVSIRSIRLLYKSESLIEQTAEAIRLGLADTGIDIERNKIELNAQNISLKGQVKVNMLETTPEQGEARITAVGSRMTASGVNGNVNLEFGVDESGNFGITFYNDDQTKVGTLDAYTMARLLELIKSQSYFDAVTFIDFDNVSVTLYRYNAASSGDPHADGDGKYFTNENDWELANGTYKGGTRNFPTFLYSWSNDGTLSGVQALQAAFVAFNVTSLKDVNGNPVEDYSSLMDGDTYDMVGYIEGRVSKIITDGVYSESTEWIYYKQQ